MDFGAGLLSLAGVAITAGATVGSAAILSDAQRSSSRTQANASIQVALSQERALLAQAQAATAQQQLASQASSQNMQTGGVALVLGVLLLGVFFGS